MGTLQELSVQSVDGGLCARKIQRALQRITQDIMARPHIVKKRAVLVRIEIEPEDQEERTIPRINYKIDVRLPPDEGAETVGYMKDGKIHVNVTNPAEPLQDSIFQNQEKDNE